MICRYWNPIANSTGSGQGEGDEGVTELFFGDFGMTTGSDHYVLLAGG